MGLLESRCQVLHPSVYFHIYCFTNHFIHPSVHLCKPIFLNFNFYLWTDLNKLSSSTACLSLSWVKTLLMTAGLSRGDGCPLNSFSADWAAATQLGGGGWIDKVGVQSLFPSPLSSPSWPANDACRWSGAPSTLMNCLAPWQGLSGPIGESAGSSGYCFEMYMREDVEFNKRKARCVYSKQHGLAVRRWHDLRANPAPTGCSRYREILTKHK